MSGSVEVPTTENNGSSSNDPYFLHHSDSPGTLLVSQVLTGENYASWYRSMTIALSVKKQTRFRYWRHSTATND